MKAERTGNGRIGWEGRLFRYISLLLIVAVLFSGVTFARYASMSEGSLTTGIARFDPSFTVDGVNSFTFGNSNYWQNYNEQWLEQGKGSARTVRISLHNDGEVKAMPAVIHMEGPAEFWENVALQMTKANADGSAGDPYTTQLVIADLLRERDGGKAVNGETHNFTYGGYINWGESDSFSTGKSEGPVEPPVTSGIANYSDDFDQRGEREETLIMSGGIKTTGTVTAVGNGYTLRITASMKEEVEYSVGFQRRDEDANEALPALYLDCRKTVPYYSVDLILPDDATNILPDDATNPFVVAPNGTNGVLDTSKGLVLFFTWTNSVSGGDFNLGITRSGTTSGTVGNDQSVAGFTWTQLSKLAQNEDGQVPTNALTFNGATVVGYHYNHLGVPSSDGSTTVRINKRFNEDPDVTYSHVATLKEDEGMYPHNLVLEGDVYKCANDGENQVTITETTINSLSKGINVDDFVYQKENPDSPTDSDNDYTLATEKGYTLSFGVTFIQAGELPAGGISTP